MPKAPAPVDPSTRRLSEVARHVVVPAGIVDTLWFEVEEQCREWGDEFDAWQDGLGQLTLGLRADGTFAATIGGCVYSIPRQVAKTFIVGRIVFALAARYPNLTILWTAHRIRTATQTFEKLKGLAKRAAVRPYMLDNSAGGIRSVNGEQEFQFANGSKIMFGAREQGFGRGFDEVDIEVFDEAQILTEKALEDMVAATNQSRFQYGALLFFMGTPPRPTDPGDEFRNRRTEALALKPAGQVMAVGEDMLYVECSADPKTGQPGGPDIDDLEQVARANPSFPHRTPLMSVKRLWKNLTSEGSKRREGLGIWDEVATTDRVIPASVWDKLAAAGPADGVAPDGIGVDASHEGVLVVAGCWRVEETVHVELLAVDQWTDDEAAADWIAEKAGRRIPVVIDRASPAARLIPLLKAHHVNVHSGTAGDMSKASGGIHAAATSAKMTHGGKGDDLLSAALAGATKRKIGEAGGWGWDRRDPTVFIAPLVSVTLAKYAVDNYARKKRTGESVFR